MPSDFALCRRYIAALANHPATQILGPLHGSFCTERATLWRLFRRLNAATATTQHGITVAMRQWFDRTSGHMLPHELRDLARPPASFAGMCALPLAVDVASLDADTGFPLAASLHDIERTVQDLNTLSQQIRMELHAQARELSDQRTIDADQAGGKLGDSLLQQRSEHLLEAAQQFQRRSGSLSNLLRRGKKPRKKVQRLSRRRDEAQGVELATARLPRPRPVVPRPAPPPPPLPQPAVAPPPHPAQPAPAAMAPARPMAPTRHQLPARAGIVTPAQQQQPQPSQPQQPQQQQQQQQPQQPQQAGRLTISAGVVTPPSPPPPQVLRCLVLAPISFSLLTSATLDRYADAFLR